MGKGSREKVNGTGRKRKQEGISSRKAKKKEEKGMDDCERKGGGGEQSGSGIGARTPGRKLDLSWERGRPKNNTKGYGVGD